MPQSSRPSPSPGRGSRKRVVTRALRALLFRSGVALTLVVVLGVFSIGMPPPAKGDLVSQTFTPVADAYVSSATPSTNFGGATRLKMDSSPVLSSYVRFDVAGLTAPVTRATLQVYMRTKSKTGFEVRGVGDNSWGETTITYANAPAFASSPSAASGAVRPGRWVTVDITPLVTGNGSLSIALTTGGTAEIDVDSREAANGPRLVVETAADVTPPNAPGNLALTSATPSTLVVSWSASTDNTGVAGYDIFLNGSKIDSTASTAYSFAGLTCATNYTLGVEAFDAAGNHSTRASVAASTTACSVATPPPFRFIYNSGSAPAAVASYGWNLIDVSSKSAADQLPSVARALVWVGDYDNTKCTWEVSDTSLKSQVIAGVGDPKIVGYFFSDEADPYACANAPAQHKARSDLIHSLDPTTRTVIVLNSNGFSGQGSQDSIDQLPLWKGTADVIGLDPYPCYQRQACDFSWIDKTIQAADAAGLNYWGVVQAFNDSTWRWPTADELTHMLNQWAASKETGSMVFAWTWSGYKLSDHPDLLTALKSFNTTGLVPSDTTPPSAPGGLTKTGATATSVSLSWTASNDDVGVTGYNVYNGSTLVTTAISTSYTVGSLSCGTSYTFGVEAKDAAGNVSTRATLSASTSPCSTSDTTPPTAPGTPTVTASDGSTITVWWTASIDNVGVAGYDLYVNGAKVANTTGTQYTFSGLSCGITYTLGVEGFDAAGNRSTRSTVAGPTSACPAGDPVITAAGDICGSPTDCAPTEKLLETIAPT